MVGQARASRGAQHTVRGFITAGLLSRRSLTGIFQRAVERAPGSLPAPITHTLATGARRPWHPYKRHFRPIGRWQGADATPPIGLGFGDDSVLLACLQQASAELPPPGFMRAAAANFLALERQQRGVRCQPYSLVIGGGVGRPA